MSSRVFVTPENKRICVSLTTCPSPPRPHRSLVLQGNDEVKKFPPLPLYTGRNDGRGNASNEKALRPRPIYGSIMLAKVSSSSLADEEQSGDEMRPEDFPLFEKGDSVFQTTLRGLLKHRKISFSSAA
jgi:hypothetical protein